MSTVEDNVCYLYQLQILVYFAWIMHVDLLLLFYQLGQVGDLPKEVPAEYEQNNDFLQKAHNVLLQVIH